MRTSRRLRFLMSPAATILSAALAVGPHALAAERPASAEASSGVLSVATSPAEAALYVDGRFVGHTPLSLESVAAGDHRVRVVKDGYLENARVVTVPAGRTQAVEIKLTPSGAAAHTDSQVTAGGGGGGGSKKWLWIGLAAAGAGTAAVLVLRGSDKPPTPGTVSVSPATGLQSSATITFTSQGASDPEGKSLTYQWDFGDGSSATGASATHVYATSGTFSSTVTVSDGKNSATASGSVTIRSMTGIWACDVFPGCAFTITQSGASISGSYRDIDGPGTLNGTVQPGNVVNITVTQPPFQPYTFAGTVSESLNTWQGTVFGFPFTATRQ